VYIDYVDIAGRSSARSFKQGRAGENEIYSSYVHQQHRDFGDHVRDVNATQCSVYRPAALVVAGEGTWTLRGAAQDRKQVYNTIKTRSQTVARITDRTVSQQTSGCMLLSSISSCFRDIVL